MAKVTLSLSKVTFGELRGRTVSGEPVLGTSLRDVCRVNNSGGDGRERSLASLEYSRAASAIPSATHVVPHTAAIVFDGDAPCSGARAAPSFERLHDVRRGCARLQSRLIVQAIMRRIRISF